MEVRKNKQRNQEKLETTRTSKHHTSIKKRDLTKEKEILPFKKASNKDSKDGKRKSITKNSEAATNHKSPKVEAVKIKDEVALEIDNSSKNVKGKRRPVLAGGKDTGATSTQRCRANAATKTKPVPSESNRDRRKKIPAVDEFLQNKKCLVTDHRKKRTYHNSDNVENKSDLDKQESGPSPEKIKKLEKDVKKSNLKRPQKVCEKGKVISRKTPAKKSKCKEKAKETVVPIPEINVDDPMAMLMMMEGRQAKNLIGSPTNKSSDVVRMQGKGEHSSMEDSVDEMHDTSDSDDLSDMEDVKDYSLPVEEEHSQIPAEGVQITLDMPDILNRKRKKKEFDWKKHLEKRVRKFKKGVAINIHKSHILCLIALGLRQNCALNDETVRGVCVSLIPSHLIKSATTCLSTERVVDSAVSWFRNVFPLNKVTHTSGLKLIPASSITGVMSQNSIADARMWVYVFIAVLRTLGLSVRLVLSLQPIPFKALDSSTGNASTSSKSSGSSKGNVTAKNKSSSSPLKANTANHVATQQSSSPSLKLSSSISSNKSSPSLSKKCTKPSSASNTKSSSSLAKKTKPSSSSNGHKSPSVRRSSAEARVKTKKNLKEDSESDDEDNEESVSREKISKSKKKKGKDLVKNSKPCNEDEDNSDSDFDMTSPYFDRYEGVKVKSNRKILSDDEEGANQKGGHDFWLEVFMQDKKKWTCFDCFKNVYNKPYSLENRATQPLSYVVAFRNDNGVKDVTARYAKQWFSVTRKTRVDPDWLEETFTLFGKASYQETVMEEDQIKGQLMVRPMPSSIGEFKSHPLYALRRHLLKFEAIYPDTAIPMGYIKKEPIYARECVHTLHSRDNWLKEGRLVRLKEDPYKMVKSRPKWNKPKENPDELDLELYGEWQTEKFIPLPAVNGKVPKNEYGNVELFKPWMLPSGTVQLRLQGLQRVARKLNIDVAPAMVGWDHHSGRAHPVFDGFIVCEEYTDTLLDAWDEDQEIQKQREDEKREKRVYGNWKLLIRGLLIKERLKNKFLLKDAPVFLDAEEKREIQAPTTSTNSSNTSGTSCQPDDTQEMKDVLHKKTDSGIKNKKNKKL